MPTRNVVLSDHQHQLVETLVESGRYQNASEVLRDGLRLVEEREAKLAALRAKINAAIEEGGSISDEELERHLMERAATLEAKAR